MSQRQPIYEGKAKIIYAGPKPDTCIQYFKDDATAFNKQKHAVMSGKGVLNNYISEYILCRLQEIGIPTHFIQRLSDREQLIRQVDIIPVEVVIRNVVAGSLCKRLALEEGLRLDHPLIEYYYKSDALGDPLISDAHIIALHWAQPEELQEIVALAHQINDYLRGLFTGIGLDLVDFKLEFGRVVHPDGTIEILLADEISPDNCRLWGRKDKARFDKDLFRHDLGDMIPAYREVAKRLGVLPEEEALLDDQKNEKR